jgi:Flp pilus assembly protein CpaB
MRPRTYGLLIVVLVALAAVVVLAVFLGDCGKFWTDWRSECGETAQVDEQPDEVTTEAEEGTPEEPSEPTPTPEPEIQFVEVMVADVFLPVGERIREDIIRVERRPDDNVAVVGGVTFSDSDEIVGQLVRTEVSSGQEILRPMLALSPNDLTDLGSDLSLYVDQGKVAVAFPIDVFSGAAYAIRPGDFVDAIMTLRLVEVDEQFQTIRPNFWERVNEQALLDGRSFLFPETSEGRLELIPTINTVAVIQPGEGKDQIPRRTTQLTLQQMEVLWMGSWRDPRLGLSQEFNADALLSSQESAPASEEGAPTPTEVPKERPENRPDLVILSLSAQDALTLKWALETGISIDLVLRAQGDTTPYITASVSLPQVLEGGIVQVPETGEFGLEPRIDEVPVPEVAPNPP